jgi:peptidoglycan/xylan/chitin deacetylase (PgdA/CDA1 family)
MTSKLTVLLLAAVALGACASEQGSPPQREDSGMVADASADAFAADGAKDMAVEKSAPRDGQTPNDGALKDLDVTKDSGALKDLDVTKDSGTSKDAGICQAPIISPAPGKHLYNTEITLGCAGADIHYTVDGTPPSHRSKKVSGPLRLTSRLSGKTIRAVAIAGGQRSQEVSGRYELHAGVIVHFKKPAGWGGAHVHYWDAVPGGLASAWPGVAMQPEGNGWYVHHFKDQTAVKLLFNANQAPQTADMNVTAAESWYDDRDDWWDMDPELFGYITWPGGKLKALVLSYDDGNVQDRRFVQLLDKYGLVGTFNLNSGKLDTPSYITSAEVKTLFAKHEVATHSVTHPYLDGLSAPEIKKELADDRTALEALVGYPVRGHAYPFGAYDETVLATMKQVGLVYGRVVPSTKDLRLPSDLLQWRGSCHHTCAYGLAQSLVAWNKSELALLQIWGHSWELDGGAPENNWAHMEAICKLLGGKSDIWYAKMIDVADYLLALRKLRFSPQLDEVKNDSQTPVWIKSVSGIVELLPGQSASLK